MRVSPAVQPLASLGILPGKAKLTPMPHGWARAPDGLPKRHILQRFGSNVESP